MAHALWAMATGRSGIAPAFIADSTHDGRTVFRYAMPIDGPGEGSRVLSFFPSSVRSAARKHPGSWWIAGGQADNYTSSCVGGHRPPV